MGSSQYTREQGMLFWGSSSNQTSGLTGTSLSSTKSNAPSCIWDTSSSHNRQAGANQVKSSFWLYRKGPGNAIAQHIEQHSAIRPWQRRPSAYRAVLTSTLLGVLGKGFWSTLKATSKFNVEFSSTKQTDTPVRGHGDEKGCGAQDVWETWRAKFNLSERTVWEGKAAVGMGCGGTATVSCCLLRYREYKDSASCSRTRTNGHKLQQEKFQLALLHCDGTGLSREFVSSAYLDKVLSNPCYLTQLWAGSWTSRCPF